MHALQEKLLKLAEERNLGRMSYREIGKMIGETHPQKVKHHLEQLERKNLIRPSDDGTLIRKTLPDVDMFSIPILGSANCGPANIFADENIEGYLRVSPKLINPRDGLYALRAVGDSMNNANVKGKSIEDQDFVIVDSRVHAPQNNDYVVSVINGLCNVKKFLKDELHKQIVLVSESFQDLPPIYIHPEEVDFFVCGKVYDVIKKPPIIPLA